MKAYSGLAIDYNCIMDQQTAEFYSKNAGDLVTRYDSVSSVVADYFTLSFAPGSKVLDVGCGSGRDLADLLSKGYDAYGVEPCSEMTELITSIPRERICTAALPKLEIPWNAFDGLLCSAVLMHVPQEELFDAAYALKRLLRENGRLLISISTPRPGLGTDNRDASGRLFIPYLPEYLQLLFERIGFQLIGRWENEDSLGRTEIHWISMLFQLRATEVSRPADQIEAILSPREKKWATYKLALIRALADIAMKSWKIVQWRPDGIVGIPIEAVTEKWILYYWSLMDSQMFIPQNRGEYPGCKKPLTFRRSLTALAEYYRLRGGLSAFYLQYRSHNLADEAQTLLKAAQKEITVAIKKGPIQYAGGSLGKAVFGFTDGLILCPADIWRELTLLGHWIIDAIYIRWAQMTSELAPSQDPVSPHEVIGRLLIEPVVERDVFAARSIVDDLKDVECVWTGKSVTARYDVDHMIPYSLWHNNDLWNLLPIWPLANNEKSDRLPSSELLINRRDAIIYYWEMYFRQLPTRFQREANLLAGPTLVMQNNWQKRLFESAYEAIELTAIQRGCPRWQP